MKSTAVLMISVFIFSCGKVKQIDTTEIKEVMRNSKIKRVTEQDLLNKVTEIGESLDTKLNGDYRVECQSTYHIDGNRVELYNAALLTSDQFKDGRKGQLLEAYKFGIENNQNPGTNVQLLNDTTYAYSFTLEDEAYLKSYCKSDFVFVILSKTQLVKQL